MGDVKEELVDRRIAVNRGKRIGMYVVGIEERGDTG
jgi:hypothetical protein